MWERIRSIWTVPDLRNKIHYLCGFVAESAQAIKRA